MQCERCRSYAINPGQNGRGDDDLHLCDVCYWRARAEAKQANAENKAIRFTGHQFQGRLDRWCEICALPDRHPIHRWEHAQVEEEPSVDAALAAACKEWLKGCTCAPADAPQQCAECTNAFLESLVRRAQELGLPVGGNAINGTSR